jgi:hypothetical protein
MLHFLLGTALCLFIGERLVRYWSAWRLRRDERRLLRAKLYQAPPQPDLWPDVTRLAAWGFACVAIFAALRWAMS